MVWFIPRECVASCPRPPSDVNRVWGSTFFEVSTPITPPCGLTPHGGGIEGRAAAGKKGSGAETETVYFRWPSRGRRKVHRTRQHIEQKAPGMQNDPPGKNGDAPPTLDPDLMTENRIPPKTPDGERRSVEPPTLDPLNPSALAYPHGGIWNTG